MKKYFQKLLLVFISLSFSLLFFISIEYFLRSKDPNYQSKLSSDNINYLNSFSSTLGWSQQKNYQVMLENRMVKTNAKGLRGKEVSYKKTPGTFRVLMLGDSITFGYRVEENETFSHLLFNNNIEVINSGVQGYGTDQELIYLQNEGLKYDPDLIVLNFCMENDFYDNSHNKSIYDNTYPKPYFKIEADKLVKHDENLKTNPFRQLLFFLTEKSLLFNKVLWSLKIDNIDLGTKLYQGNLVVSGPNKTPIDTELTYRLILEANNIAKQNGANFLLAVYPGEKDFNGDTDAFKKLESQMTSWNINTIYMNRAFQEKGYNLERFNEIASDYIMHPTPLGHKIIAEIFSKYFMSYTSL